MRDSLAGIQRSRLVAAMGELCRERGVAGVTIAHVVTRSGVSRRTFYEIFADREACFLAAFDEAVERAAARAKPAFRAPGPWRERARAALVALLEFLDDEPALSSLCIVGALGGGPAVLARRARVLETLVDAVDEGRAEAVRGAKPTRMTAERVVGAVLGLLHTRLTATTTATGGPATGGPAADGGAAVEGSSAWSCAEAATDLLGPLMAIVVLPYAGQAAATRELSRPAPPARRVAASAGDPLRGLGVRLTYRTMRVLLAIAARPGASNRGVADLAGVHDPGRISKLLARLEHVGLTRNDTDGAMRGEPNAWSLTQRGERVAEAVAQQSRAGA